MDNAIQNTSNIHNNEIISTLESSVPTKDNLRSNLRDERQCSDLNISDENSEIIKNVNGAVLLHYLSPEINNNEASKRKHKYILITLVGIFLYFQFNTVYEMSSKVMDYAIDKEANIEIIKLLIAFVSAYITSVVVELIAILNYVVKRVFDTSIKELIELFKEDDRFNPNKEQEN